MMVSRSWNFPHEFPNILVRFKPVYVLAGVPGQAIFLVRIDPAEHENRLSVRKEQRVVEKVTVFVRSYYTVAYPLWTANNTELQIL